MKDGIEYNTVPLVAEVKTLRGAIRWEEVKNLDPTIGAAIANQLIDDIIGDVDLLDTAAYEQAKIAYKDIALTTSIAIRHKNLFALQRMLFGLLDIYQDCKEINEKRTDALAVSHQKNELLALSVTILQLRKAIGNILQEQTGL